MNMLNCCNVEIQFSQIGDSKMLVLIPNGKYLIDFGKMLRTDDKCYSFTVENVNMYCKGKTGMVICEYLIFRSSEVGSKISGKV